jgi:hypothetical protein
LHANQTGNLEKEQRPQAASVLFVHPELIILSVEITFVVIV